MSAFPEASPRKRPALASGGAQAIVEIAEELLGSSKNQRLKGNEGMHCADERMNESIEFE